MLKVFITSLLKLNILNTNQENENRISKYTRQLTGELVLKETIKLNHRKKTSLKNLKNGFLNQQEQNPRLSEYKNLEDIIRDTYIKDSCPRSETNKKTFS